MIPIGYIYKTVVPRTGWLKTPNVADIYSASGCASEYFDNYYTNYWKHNGYWFFDTPRIIEDLAKTAKIDLSGMTLFYYEAHEQEFDEKTGTWSAFAADSSFKTDVRAPAEKHLWGFDVVQVLVHSDLGCSPLSCNGLAEKLPVNRVCLFDTFEQAKDTLDRGLFVKCEPGPFRIVAVYTPGDDQR
jgi:hypothetical protein